MERKTNKIAMILILVGLTMGLVSAYNLTAGEPYNITLEEEFEYYSIVGNSTPIDLNVTANGLNVTITTSKYLESTSFDLIFFNLEGETITEHHYSSRGTRIIYRDRNITVPDITIVDDTTIKLNDEEIEEPSEEEKTVPLWLWLSIIGTIILIILLYILTGYLTNKREEGMEEIDNQT